MENKAEQHWNKTLTRCQGFQQFLVLHVFLQMWVASSFYWWQAWYAQFSYLMDAEVSLWALGTTPPLGDRPGFLSSLVSATPVCLSGCSFKFKSGKKFSPSPHPVTLPRSTAVECCTRPCLCQFSLWEAKLLEVRDCVLFAVSSPIMSHRGWYIVSTKLFVDWRTKRVWTCVSTYKYINTKYT